MKRYLWLLRIGMMMIFIQGAFKQSYAQISNVIYGSYDTLEKEKQLITLLEKIPAYDSAKVEYPLISQLEKWVSNQFLDYTLYTPQDSFEAHPMVIFMNGGGLLFSQKDDKTMKLLGERLGEEGIGFMAIEYRTEILTLLSVNQAGYLAIQDFHEAIKYSKSIAGDYKISTDHIYIGGIGCGAVTALHTAALQEDEVDYDQFAFYDEKFGCLNCGGHSEYNSEVRGVINLSGGIIDLDILEDERFKLLQFYGENDDIISSSHGKPFEDLLSNSLGFFDEWIKLDVREPIANTLYKFMDVPELYGAMSIDSNKAAYPQMSITTVPFPNYGHQLLISNRNNRSMTPTNKIIEEIVDFVKSDLKPEVETMIMPSKTVVNKQIVLKGPEASNYRWFLNGTKIHEAKDSRFKYRLKAEGEHEIGLMVQNEFGVWSDVRLMPITVLPKKKVMENLEAVSRNPWSWVGFLAVIGLILFLISRKKRNNRQFIN